MPVIRALDHRPSASAREPLVGGERVFGMAAKLGGADCPDFEEILYKRTLASLNNSGRTKRQLLHLAIIGSY
jgi:hypothetical protein